MPGQITLGGIALPGDLAWVDEFNWCPVVREVTYSLTGALIISESVKLAGRPITLEAKQMDMGWVWVVLATVVALYALAATPGWTGLLTLADGRTFTVAFREDGVTATPVLHRAPAAEGDAYALTLKLQVLL
jgi:hypothetical protein